MSSRVQSVRAFSLTQPREIPYLGALRSGEEPNAKGYFVRKGNGTVYPVFDRSVLVRIETECGTVGWGETYGLVAPGAVGAIIDDLLADFTIGRDPTDPAAVYDDLYGLVRVRGYTGGFYVDALAAIDIALWDIAARLEGMSVTELLGGAVRDQIPAYISGLPESTIGARADLAESWQSRGFDAFKFAAPVADDGLAAEIEALRAALGPDARIAADMHWQHDAQDAIGEIRAMAAHGLWFAEAPVRPEDVDGLEAVCRNAGVPIAAGEEWRTHHDLLHRVTRCGISIVQPEMGHTGITGFTRMARLAERHSLDVIPHATVGSGIFLAASLQASAALEPVSGHEFQHSIFESSRDLLTGDMDCAGGSYTPSGGPGLGVEPSELALRRLKSI